MEAHRWISALLGLGVIVYVFWCAHNISRKAKGVAELHRRDYHRDQWKLLAAGILMAAVLGLVGLAGYFLHLQDNVARIVFYFFAIAIAVAVTRLFNRSPSKNSRHK
jgi:hypothetical protein